MEYDEDAGSFVTYVKELHRMSTYGETESAALGNTAEMIRGYIKSMEANRKRIPLASSKLAELKRVAGCADVLQPRSFRQGCRSSAGETWFSACGNPMR